MRTKPMQLLQRGNISLITVCFALSCLCVAVLADDVRGLPLNRQSLTCIVQDGSDSDGLYSPLHSIFDYDGSDITSSQGLVATPLHAFVLSFTMIIISELGDKTFLIAALMAMRHPRGVVFFAAFASLLIMTVLSAALGHAVPHLSTFPNLTRRLTDCSTSSIYGPASSHLIPGFWY
jgi:hypothetical protein